MASTEAQSLVPVIFDPHGDVTVTLLYHDDAAVPAKPEASLSTKQARIPKLDDTDEEEPATEADRDAKKVIFRCSLKHLALASPHARMVLQGPSSEATTIHADGTRHWTIRYPFDAEAFHVVLKIIHGLNRSVPKTLALEKLAHVAVVVDDLNCEPAVCFSATSWIERIPGPKPETSCLDLARWILITSVFRDFKNFEAVTKSAILVSMGSPSEAYGLPIPHQIFETIKERRKAALDEMRSMLDATRRRLKADDTLSYSKFKLGRSSSRVPCSYDCRSALLGSLTIFEFDLGWARSIPASHDYGSASVQSVLDVVWKIKSPSVCKHLKPGGPKYQEVTYGFGTTTPCCSVKTLMGPQLKKMVDRVAGLQLQQFIPK